MSFAVAIEQFEGSLAVAPGRTILEAALERGLPYPYGCQSGNCGACKSLLIDGEVEMGIYSGYALTDDERRNGLILACRATPWSDCRVRYLELDEIVAHPQRRMTARLVGLDRMTDDIRRLRFEIVEGGPFHFSAGQYAAVEFPGLPARDYSMANRPDETTIEFHIRLAPGGAVTPFVAERLRPGDTARIAGPLGTSYLRENHTGPIVALAGGSGLAPIKAIVETALAKGARQPIALYFGARDEPDLYLEEEFIALARRHPNLSFIPVLSEPRGATGRRTGFLADVVGRDFSAGGLDGAKAYLAGPPVMVETATEALIALGLRRGDCHADAFYTEADRAALAATAS